MLTFAEFVAVISLCVSSFGLGYKLGRDRRNDHDRNAQK